MKEDPKFWNNLIPELRREQGISQRRLAAIAKVSRSTLRRIEAGRSSNMSAIERAAAARRYRVRCPILRAGWSNSPLISSSSSRTIPTAVCREPRKRRSDGSRPAASRSRLGHQPVVWSAHLLRAGGEMQLRAISFLGLAAALLAAPPADAAKCPRGTLTGQVTHGGRSDNQRDHLPRLPIGRSGTRSSRAPSTVR